MQPKAQTRTPASLVDRGEATGRTYLKIPLPEPDLVRSLLDTVGSLLAQVLAKK